MIPPTRNRARAARSVLRGSGSWSKQFQMATASNGPHGASSSVPVTTLKPCARANAFTASFTSTPVNLQLCSRAARESPHVTTQLETGAGASGQSSQPLCLRPELCLLRREQPGQHPFVGLIARVRLEE
jgi:hypothetical protein